MGNDNSHHEGARAGDGELSDTVQQQLRAALAGGDMDECVQALTAAALGQRMTPEKLLVIIKEQLTTAPAFKALSIDERDDVRTRIITRAIKQYFG